MPEIAFPPIPSWNISISSVLLFQRRPPFLDTEANARAAQPTLDTHTLTSLTTREANHPVAGGFASSERLPTLKDNGYLGWSMIIQTSLHMSRLLCLLY
jgi:hypothetical protein